MRRFASLLMLALAAVAACRPAAKEVLMSSTAPSSRPARQNRLREATSPYLQQHAHNPVDWYEWGPEALDTARRENKPIFLSIGYSACHWCHVMAHESFEDPQIAAVMNRLFVNVKVDREERPDIDEIYMQATMILNRGQGGWPMSVWLTPDLQPFFAGTYFPPDEKWGRPGFRQLCERIGELWATRPEALRSDAAKLSAMVRDSLSVAEAAGAAIALADIDRTADMLADVFDPVHGGMSGGGTNKFPPTMAMELMLRSARRSEDASRRARLESLVKLTLDRMAGGGVYDQLGGGIHRYSTDVEWLVPHFEKMLYDQALVSRAYLDAHQYFAAPQYAETARDIFDYVIRDLQSPEGGFYSTRDADSEGEEGRYYVWTRAEVAAVVGAADAPLICDYFDVRETGNWDDPHAPGVPKNVLHVPRDLATVAKLHRLDPDDARRRIDAARRRLLDARAKRVAPGRDEKILAEWNGMMIASLARGGATLDEPRHVAAAARAAEFVLARQRRDGRLLRAYRDGRTLETAFLTDYACMIDGLLELYEATFERRWLDAAIELNAAAVRLFADAERGGFYFTAADHESLLARSKDVRDGATPSGNSVQLMNLLRLADLLGDPALRELADRSLQCFAADVLQRPGASERFLAAAEFALEGPVEIVIVGPREDPATGALRRAARTPWLPNRVLALVDPARPGEAPQSPLTLGRTPVDGKPAAYVCRNYACKRPVTEATELTAALTAR